MVKSIILLMTALLFLRAEDEIKSSCIDCHNQVKIPTEAIYMRYLLIYSDKKQLKKAMMSYLTNPSYETSAMPQGFLQRFGIKEPISMPKEVIEREVDLILDYYDIRKRVKLKKSD